MISSRVWPSFANENRHEEYIVYIIFEPIGASINTYAAKISKRKKRLLPQNSLIKLTARRSELLTLKNT